MVSGIGGGGGGMPSLDAMKQLQQRAFEKADVNRSEGLDRSEFDAFVKEGPAGRGAVQGADAAAMFERIDADGDGQLSGKEMDGAGKRMFDVMHSTLHAFGAQSSRAGASDGETWNALREALIAPTDSSSDESSGSGDEALMKRLRALVDHVANTYGALDQGRSRQTVDFTV